MNLVTPEAPIAEIAVDSLTPRRDPPWTLADLLIIMVIFALSLMAAVTIGLAVAHQVPLFSGIDRAALSNNPLFFIPVQFVSYLLTFVFTRMLITLRAQNDFWSAVKWNFPQGIAPGTFAFAGVVLALAVQAVSNFLPIPKALPIERYFHDAPSAYMMLVFGVLVAPLLEELLFRGLLFPVLSRAMGMTGGVVLTAALFALMHQGQLSHAWAPLLLLFVVGVILTVTRARTQSLAASWIMHFAYNATLFGLLFIASHGFRNFENIAH